MDKNEYVDDMMDELERLREDAKNEETEQVRASIRRMRALTKKLKNGLKDNNQEGE